VLDVSELQTGVLSEARQHDGRMLEGVEGGGGLQPWQYDGQLERGGLEELRKDGELGDAPERVGSGPVLQCGGGLEGVEVVEVRVSGGQPCDGVEEVVEVVEVHGEP